MFRFIDAIIDFVYLSPHNISKTEMTSQKYLSKMNAVSLTDSIFSPYESIFDKNKFERDRHYFLFWMKQCYQMVRFSVRALNMLKMNWSIISNTQFKSLINRMWPILFGQFTSYEMFSFLRYHQIAKRQKDKSYFQIHL